MKNTSVEKINRYKNIFKDLNKKIEEVYCGKKLDLCTYIRLGLICKYDKSIKAIYKLDMLGFFEDANIILRTVFENFITIMYCEIEPQKRYERFLNYNCIIRNGYLKRDMKIYEIFEEIKNGYIINLKEQVNEYKKKYNGKNFCNWSGKDISNICKSLDKYYRTSFYNSMYMIIYKQYSEYIHPNIVNIFENYISINNNKLVLNCNPNPDNENFEIIENLEEINKKIIECIFYEGE